MVIHQAKKLSHLRDSYPVLTISPVTKPGQNLLKHTAPKTIRRIPSKICSLQKSPWFFHRFSIDLPLEIPISTGKSHGFQPKRLVPWLVTTPGVDPMLPSRPAHCTPGPRWAHGFEVVNVAWIT